MNLSIVRRKSRKKHADKPTNDKDTKKRIPAKKQRLHIRVSNAGRLTLNVEDVASRDIETFETEGDTDERPSKKQKRFVERSKTPSKRRSRNKR